MAYVYRDDTVLEGKKEVPIAFDKIMERREPDIALMPNEVLDIPENGRFCGWATAMDWALMLTGRVLGTALIHK